MTVSSEARTTLKPILSVKNLSVSYGNVEALHGVSISVSSGQIVAVIGPNGAGKTTMLAAIMGQLASKGEIEFLGRDQSRLRVEQRVFHGMTLLPETRELFGSMTVEDILIIGAGPTGATAAIALATYGIRVHMISRSSWLADSPRAHITNQRTNEVFRDLGIGEDIARSASPWNVMGDTTFTTSLAGEELVRLRTWGTGDDRKGDYLRASPCGMVDIVQPMLEPVLVIRAAERGATFTFNTEYLGLQQEEARVAARLRDVRRVGSTRCALVSSLSTVNGRFWPIVLKQSFFPDG